VIAAHAPEPARFRRVLAAIHRAADEAGQAEIIVVRNGGPEIAAATAARDARTPWHAIPRGWNL
jgi:hypothetical protein